LIQCSADSFKSFYAMAAVVMRGVLQIAFSGSQCAYRSIDIRMTFAAG